MWSPWVKPVLFAEIQQVGESVIAEDIVLESRDSYSVGFRQDTAVIVDLPGAESLKAGYVLANEGHRPVPLYNTTSGTGQRLLVSEDVVINVTDLVLRLALMPPKFVVAAIERSGPPAFLLDRRRLKGGPAPGTYDNRWMVFPQDFPSANFLKSRGIKQAVVLQDGGTQPEDDLRHVLLRWQEAAIRILVKDTTSWSGPTPIEVRRPSRFRWAIYRALAIMGLRRSSAGGFGAVVPLPGQGGIFG